MIKLKNYVKVFYRLVVNPSKVMLVFLGKRFVDLKVRVVGFKVHACLE